MPRTGYRNKSLWNAARWPWIVIASSAWLLACGGGGTSPPATTIGKQKFIDTYVELREAAADLDSARLDSARAAILHRNGVTQQDMLTFANVHGPDVVFMKEVWDSVEHRLDKSPPAGVEVP